MLSSFGPKKCARLRAYKLVREVFHVPKDFPVNEVFHVPKDYPVNEVFHVQNLKGLRRTAKGIVTSGDFETEPVLISRADVAPGAWCATGETSVAVEPE